MLISFNDIVKYVGGGLRPIIEGSKLLEADFIIACGYSSSIREKIIALCIQSSAIMNSPHKIEIVLKKNCKDWMCSCSCKAGAGQKCKHIVAALLYINKSDSIDDFSCTDLEQVWGKRRAKKITEAEPLNTFCHVKLSTENLEIPEALCKIFFNDCMQAAGSSEAALHLRGRKTISNASAAFGNSPALISTEDEIMQNIFTNIHGSEYCQFVYQLELSSAIRKCCADTYNKIYPCEAIEICKKTLKDNDLWMKSRQFRVTASRCYSLYTYSKDDWDIKAKKYFDPQKFTNIYMEYGKQQEKHARLAYELQKGVKVFEIGLIVLPSNPWLACSPDGIVLNKDNKLVKLIEIKCPYIGSQYPVLECLARLPFLKNNALNKKHPYYGQVQLSMFILNLCECDFIVYASFDKKCYSISVKIDEQFCRDLVSKLKNVFFTRMLPMLCCKI